MAEVSMKSIMRASLDALVQESPSQEDNCSPLLSSIADFGLAMHTSDPTIVSRGYSFRNIVEKYYKGSKKQKRNVLPFIRSELIDQIVRRERRIEAYNDFQGWEGYGVLTAVLGLSAKLTYNFFDASDVAIVFGTGAVMCFGYTLFRMYLAHTELVQGEPFKKQKKLEKKFPLRRIQNFLETYQEQITEKLRD
jgi:hypothetical protein